MEITPNIGESTHKPLYLVTEGSKEVALVYSNDKVEVALSCQIDPSKMKDLDFHIPVIKRGNMFHVVTAEGNTVGFATTHLLARTKWYDYRDGRKKQNLGNLLG